MTGEEWLNYFLADQQPDERKASWLDTAGGIVGAGVGALVGGPPGAVAGYGIGSAAGNAGENAINHTLTPENLIGDATQAVGGYGDVLGAMNDRQAMGVLKKLTDAGWPMGFQDGGVVPDASAGQFVPLSSDPAMRSALGIREVAPQSSREHLLDLLAASLAGIHIPAPRSPHAPASQRLLGSAAESAANVFALSRVKKNKDREEQIARNDERMKMLNVADINAALARRRKVESDTDSEKRRQAAWEVVPQAWAAAAGKPELSGQRVDHGTYTGLKNAYEAWKDARPKPTTEKITPDQRFRLESNGRRFGQRVKQIEARIEALQRRADDPLYEGDETITEKISTLAEALAQVHDQWDAADARVYGTGAGAPAGGKGAGGKDRPVTASPAGPVRVRLADGRTGTLPAGSTLPAGAQVIPAGSN